METETASETAHIGNRSVFDQADVDKDGKLSHQEIATHHHEQELEIYDLDRDGHISKLEWSAAHPSSAESDARFNHVDKDSNGLVSKEEAVLFVTEHVTFDNLMTKYDADSDESLHWNELDEGAPTEMRITMFSIPI
jgi:Ca2+-binding EF-hand superfamily protein